VTARDAPRATASLFPRWTSQPTRDRASRGRTRTCETDEKFFQEKRGGGVELLAAAPSTSPCRLRVLQSRTGARVLPARLPGLCCVSDFSSGNWSVLRVVVGRESLVKTAVKSEDRV
jgi:hypothetical protein